tara:strand:- start:50 stop:649 length:600 start_codon:yes stop_codon:yes gene_type:complete
MKFDFIEIGTSDFNTLTQEYPSDSFNKKGISIDPLKYYLDRLPNNDNVIKVNCAISDDDYTTQIFWVHPEDIEKYDLPWWWKGCNSILKPHLTVVKGLEEWDLMSVYRIDKCKCISWSTLIDTYDISFVDFLKIDTEGHDCQIINNIFKTNKILPNKIEFEHNILTDEYLFNSTMELLNNNKYFVIERGADTITVEFKN